MKIKKISKIKYNDDVYNLRIKNEKNTNHNYFANDVCVSNCHHAKANSIQDIIIKCYNNEYRFGLTGTLPPEGSTDSFLIQAYLGPNVYTIHSADLIEEGSATPVNVVGIELDYLDEVTKEKLYNLRNVSADEKDGSKLLNLEKGIARENRKRFNFIVNKISETTKNSLVLFADIKNNYGRDVYDWLRSNTNKNVYYIDGGIKSENREYYKKQMEENKDVILVASTGTFSEGIDVLNLHNIFILESNKSEYIVRQILGRGMRLMAGKDMILVIDFSDNFQYGSGNQRINYLIRHANERERIYHSKGFPYKRFQIKI